MSNIKPLTTEEALEVLKGAGIESSYISKTGKLFSLGDEVFVDERGDFYLSTIAHIAYHLGKQTGKAQKANEIKAALGFNTPENNREEGHWPTYQERKGL